MLQGWVKDRLREPSTYGGLAGLFMMIGVATFTFWPDWRLMMYASGLLFIVQAILSEKSGQ